MVLLAIAQFVDEHAVGFPGQATLSATTEQGVRTVRRHLDFLEKRGLLVRTPRWRKDGTRTSDLYQLAGGQRPAAKLAGYEPANRPNSAGQPAKMTATPAAKLAGDPVRDPNLSEILSDRSDRIISDSQNQNQGRRPITERERRHYEREERLADDRAKAPMDLREILKGLAGKE